MNSLLRDNQLRVLWVARIDYSKNSGVKMHHHDDFYQLLLVIEGKGSIQIEQETFPILNEHLYLLPKGKKHSFHFDQKSTTIDFKFEIESTTLSSYIQSGQLSSPCPIGNLNEWKQLYKLSSSNLNSSKPLLAYRIDVGFKAALLTILDKEDQSFEMSPESTLLIDAYSDYPVVQFLKEHLHSKITLEDMANHFNFHPHYLIELFRKKAGTTPMQYLQTLRIEKAKEYLEFTTISISEIADLVGLTPPYFTRLFQNRLGISPSSYRERTRTVIGKDIVLEEDPTSFLENQPSVWNQ